MYRSRTIHLFTLLLIPTLCLAAPPPEPPTLPTSVTQTFLGNHLGLKAMTRGTRLASLYGVTVDTGTGTARALTDSFLGSNADALGVDEVTLVYDSQVDTGDGKFTIITYTQQIEGLPAHGTYVKIPVVLGSPKRISYIGMRLMYLPENPPPSQNEISAQDAIDVVDGPAHTGT